MKILNSKLFDFSLILICLLLASFQIFTVGIQDWDEARNGVNALEMLINKNYIHLYYQGQPDTWNVKPPLLIWLIGISYKLFGFNIVGFRMPIFLALIGFIILFYQIIRKWQNHSIAFCTILIWLTTNLAISKHVFLTADFDGLLIFFFLLATFYYWKFLDSNLWRHLYILVFSLIAAFYTKGFVVLVFVFGLLIHYFFLMKRNVSSRILMSAIICVFGMFSWVVILTLFPIPIDPSNTFYKDNNLVSIMTYHDIYRRIFDSSFGDNSNYHYTLRVIFDSFQIWIILAILGIFYNMYCQKNFRFQIFENTIWFAILQIFPLLTILIITKNNNTWYIAPAFPFLSYLLAILLDKTLPKSILKPIILVCFFILFSIRLNVLWKMDKEKSMCALDNPQTQSEYLRKQWKIVQMP